MAVIVSHVKQMLNVKLMEITASVKMQRQTMAHVCIVKMILIAQAMTTLNAPTIISVVKCVQAMLIVSISLAYLLAQVQDV